MTSITSRNSLTRLCEKRSDEAISEFRQPRIRDRHVPLLRSVLAKTLAVFVALFVISIPTGIAANPPKELQRVIENFLNMESTSMELTQVIDWKYSADNDVVTLRMDVRSGQQFRVDLPAFGLEIFVNETEMMTLNHIRKQILYEDATPAALLNQLFAGGDLNQTRFKGEKKLSGGHRELTFTFDTDFSDWDRLSVTQTASGVLKQIDLIDYDGNHYKISIDYLDKFMNFVLPSIGSDFSDYKVADLRE